MILFPLISVVLSLIFKVNFLASILLFYGLPSLWLSLRTPAQIKKTFLFSLIISIPLGLFIDYLAIKDGAWFVPTTYFSFRLLGVIPIEDLIFGFFLIYSIVIFYEHFLDKGKHELVDKKMKYLIWPIVTALTIFIILLINRPNLLTLPFAYFWLGITLFFSPAIMF